MSGAGITLLFLTLALYATASALLAARRGGSRVYRGFSAAILVVQGSFIALRWVETGHPPILGTFEEALAASFTLVAFGLSMDSRGAFARFIVPFAFATLLYGLAYEVEGRPLIISEQSWWVYFHALFAWIAYGYYTLAFAGASSTLISGRRWGRWASVDPAVAARLVERGVFYGFAAQTAMYLLGSYYSSRLHGSWWVWDPVEYLFVASWFLYAAVVHGRLFFGWSRRRVAGWVVGAYVVTLVFYWGLVFFYWSTYHVFDIGYKMH